MSGGLGVAVMAGGKGRRLLPVAGGGPKALAPFAGSTLLDHQLDRVAPLQPSSVVVVACHHAGALRAHLEGRQVGAVQVGLYAEEAPLGTAGGLFYLPPEPARWLVLNVDHVSDVDLSEFVASAAPPCTALLVRRRLAIDEGVVEVEGGFLRGWTERPALELAVTTGLYAFERAALAAALDGGRRDMPDLVRDLFPVGVHARMHAGTWFDAGTPDRLRAAERWWLGRGGVSKSVDPD